LISEERAISFVIDDLATRKLCFFGITGFVLPQELQRALAGRASALRQPLLELEASGKPPFLSRRQVAKANTAGNLVLVHLFGCPDTAELDSPRGQEIHRMAYEAFAFSHGGYRIKEFWQEAVVPEAATYAESTGAREVRRRDAMGAPVRLFRFTREDAVANPGHPLAYLMKYPAARFGLTESQQRLLELALLDVSDRDAASMLFVSAAAIKKRWRSIYTRVEHAAPALAGPDVNGADQRRRLLSYLRQHLEELRPTTR
jgi:hypothetical protein